MRQHAIYMVVIGGSALPLSAHASPVSRQFCADYTVDYDDLNVGDKLTSPTAPARGGVLRFTDQHGSVTEFNLDVSGTTVGCKSITLDGANTYTIRLLNEALVASNTLEVTNADTGAIGSTTVETGYVPVTGSTLRWTLSATGATRILAAAETAILGNDGGLSNIFEFHVADCPYLSTGSSCYLYNGTHAYEFYIGNTLSKFNIATVFGYGMFNLANNAVAPSTDDTSAVEDCVPGEAGYDPPSHHAHKMNSTEYQSEAAVNGAADFFAALAFNDTGLSIDCDFWRENVDWNRDGSINASDPVTISCRGSARNFDCYGNDCQTGNGNNRSAEVDWLRMWWTVRNDDGLNLADIFNLWHIASPDDWNANGNGNIGSNWPAARFQGAANVTFLTAWSTQAAQHGVDR